MALAGITWKKKSRRGLAAFAAAWGLVSWAVGVTQSQMVPGSLHWIVETAHAAIGVIAIVVGGRLAIGVAARHIASHGSM